MVSSENVIQLGEASDEGAKRKARSEEILRNAGVAVHPGLPEVETANQIEPRSAVEIARRAICLLLVAARSELDRDTLRMLIEGYGMAGHFTNDEQGFLDIDAPPTADIDQFSWRSEASWTLFWALGFVDNLGLPVEQIAPYDAIEIVESNGFDGLVSNASLRPTDEILDAADLIYRCHWATRSFQLDGITKVGQLEAEVTVERHHALNWLIRYNDQEWDDISTDT